MTMHGHLNVKDIFCTIKNNTCDKTQTNVDTTTGFSLYDATYAGHQHRTAPCRLVLGSMFAAALFKKPISRT